MGKNKKKFRHQKQATDDFEIRGASPPIDVKQMGKKKKKNKKNKHNSVDKSSAAKSDAKCAWFLVRVHSKSHIPAKEFLQESFKTMMDEEWTMFGYHQSSSAKFYVEGSTVARSIEGLSRRLKGVDGSLLSIDAQPCKQFLLLNSEQIKILREVLARHYDASLHMLDLTKLHSDPQLVANDIILVLSDPDILKQVMVQVRDNLSCLQGIVLSHNHLSLANVKSVCGMLKDSPLQGLNLEQNNIASIRDLANSLSVFSSTLLELKLEGNPCIKDLKTQAEYMKVVCSKLKELKVLDGVNIEEFFLKIHGQSIESSAASGSSSSSTVITDTLVEEFLKQFYSLLDTSERSKLLDAFTPDANFGLDSPFMQSGRGSGTQVITEGLQLLPQTRHLLETFALEKVRLEPSLAQYVVRGKAELQGQSGQVSFAHSYAIVPYNSGVGCSTCVLEYK